MANENRTLQERKPFYGDWRGRGPEYSQPLSEAEMEKVFEEIDQDLSAGNSQRGSQLQRPRGKGTAMPLILAPPVIKSVEEKPFSTRFTASDSFEDESADILESSGELESIEESNEQEILESQENEERLTMLEDEESSELTWISIDDENEDDELFLKMLEDDESEEYTEESDNIESYESVELHQAEPEDIGFAPAAYRGKHYDVADTKVRLPVHLANVDLEIDIFDTFTLSRPISSVDKVECSLHSIDVEALLPSSKLFTKGVLLLNIDYVSTNDCGTMHSVKMHIPWKKIIEIDWLQKPELSWKNSKEYMYTTPFGDDPAYHREFCESLVEKITFNLSSLHAVWNEQFISHDRVLVQGTARMDIDLYQKQNLDLSRILGQ